MKRRRLLQGLFGLAIALPPCAYAEPSMKMAHIGYLGSTSPAEQQERVAAMLEGFRQLGYVDGANIVMHYRWAEGRYERLPGLAAELVAMKVDVIMTHGTPGTRAAMAATSTIPIVAIVVGDLLSHKLVPSLARPGGNLTGQTFFFAEICAKRIELIKEAVPTATRIAALINPANALHPDALSAMTQTAEALQVNLLSFEAKTRNDLPHAIASMREAGVHAGVIVDDPILIGSADALSKLSLKARIPLIGEKAHTAAGGLMSYGVDLSHFWLYSANLAHRILKGAKPSDLPILQASKFELVVNLTAAQAFALSVPPSLLARADEVIE